MDLEGAKPSYLFLKGIRATQVEIKSIKMKVLPLHSTSLKPFVYSQSHPDTLLKRINNPKDTELNNNHYKSC